jgi:Tfp pilus assembly protein PilN
MIRFPLQRQLLPLAGLGSGLLILIFVGTAGLFGTTARSGQTGDAAEVQQPVAEKTEWCASSSANIVFCSAAAEGMPEAPKVSSFAPAEDLADQADKYIKGLEETVKAVESGDEKYDDVKEKIGKESNTLAILALCLGKHDKDSKYKAQAGALLKASQELAASSDLASAKKALAKVQDAASGKLKVADVELKWEKVDSLPDLMKQVPSINTKLKAYVKPAKFKSKAKDSAGITAVMAAIAQGSMADLSATKSPDQAAQWYKFCEEMRVAAAATNKSIRDGDAEATKKNLLILGKNCEDCHAVFHPEAKIEE